MPILDLDAHISELRGWHRERVAAMAHRKRCDLALGAFIRAQLGWRPDLPKAEGDHIKARALALIEIGMKVIKADVKAAKAGRASNMAKSPADPDFAKMSGFILGMIRGRLPATEIEVEAAKNMQRLAESLPAWIGFGADIKGFGSLSLAVIVAEAGDLSGYSNPAKLWKRMGLAPISKLGITKSGAAWRKGGLNAQDWTDAGYCMRRRSHMFVIGDTLIKKQNVYREIYLERKEFERAKAMAAGLTVAPAAKIPAARAIQFISDGHIHRRAQRYMEKRLLRELWKAWRDCASLSLSSATVLPISPNNPADEVGCEADMEVSPIWELPRTKASSAREGRRAIRTMTPKARLPVAKNRKGRVSDAAIVSSPKGLAINGSVAAIKLLAPRQADGS